MKRGYQVTLVTGPSWGREGEILSEALEEGMEVAILPGLGREIRPWKDLLVLCQLTSWLKKNRYAIIHTHTSKAGFLGRLAARWARVPVVIHTPHGHVFHSYFSPWKEKFFLKLERLAARWSERLVSLTERCREEHLALAVGSREQWVIIPSGVDERRFQNGLSSRGEVLGKLGIPQDRKIVGFIGRLAPVKGPRYLVEALPEISRAFPDIHCVMVGDGEERETLRRRIEELGLASRVSLAGHQESVAEFLSCFDLVVVPSLNEGMGRVIVEAGLLKKPVIGTAVGGILDLIEDGKTGVLIERRNPHQIAKSVIQLLRDPELSRRLAEALHVKVLNSFTEEQMVDRIDRLYREELKKKGILSEAAFEWVESRQELKEA